MVELSKGVLNAALKCLGFDTAVKQVPKKPEIQEITPFGTANPGDPVTEVV